MSLKDKFIKENPEIEEWIILKALKPKKVRNKDFQTLIWILADNIDPLPDPEGTTLCPQCDGRDFDVTGGTRKSSDMKYYLELKCKRCEHIFEEATE